MQAVREDPLEVELNFATLHFVCPGCRHQAVTSDWTAGNSCGELIFLTKCSGCERTVTVAGGDLL